MRTHPKHAGKKGGFTLIEMLVAVTLFAMVMVVATSAIFTIVNADKKAEALNSVVNNLNFSIESMVRDMKTGIRYTCPSSNGTYTNSPALDASIYADEISASHDLCTDATIAVPAVTLFSTLSGSPKAVEYRYMPADANGTGRIVHTDLQTGSTPEVSYVMTSPEINVTSVKFYVANPGNGGTPKIQPSIFITITAEANVGDNQVTKFRIQTFVSQRILNI